MEGVERYKVRLMPHNPQWAEEFAQVKQELLEILGDCALDIQHVGSTAVPGLDAKPILDVAVKVLSFSQLKRTGAPELVRRGYDDCGEKDDGYLFVHRGEGQISLRHLHCYEPDSAEFENQINFRNYLIRHSETAREYHLLKHDLAARYPDDRPSYTRSKEDFIMRVIAQAKAEKKS